jgi:hypothetical protein
MILLRKLAGGVEPDLVEHPRKIIKTTDLDVGTAQIWDVHGIGG